MKKDNVVIRASEGLAVELELQGYEEVAAKESKSKDVAVQPVPYDKEDVEKVKQSVEDNKDVIVTEKEANAKEDKKAK
jgi:hypothetical protein